MKKNINWSYFPKTDPLPIELKETIEIFEKNFTKIDTITAESIIAKSSKKRKEISEALESDDVLKILTQDFLDANYKNFDLSAVFAGQGQVRQYVLPESGTVGNFYSSWADNRWSPDTPQGSYPRVSERASSAVSGGRFRNDFWLRNTAFVRLKNIQLGYTFSPKVLENTPFSNINIYVQGENLLTFSKWRGWDAEGGFTQTASSNYPTPKIYTFGLNVNL